MKRRISVLLVFFLSVLTACGGSGSPAGSGTDSIINSSVASSASDNVSNLPSDDASVSSEVRSEVDITVEQKTDLLIEQMELEEKIYQLLVVTPEQLTGEKTVTKTTKALKNALAEHPVGGVVLFAKNITGRKQVTKLLSGIKEASAVEPFLCVDEEGGRVARVGNNPELGTTAFPAMLTVGADGDTSAAQNVGRVIGSELLELGFNLDFAPVADVFTNPENTVIGDRAFSTDPEIAAGMVSAAVKGFNESGMLCTLKHFPGHGDTAQDSHKSPAFSLRGLEELLQNEFLPFSAGISAGAPLVMVGHISLPNVTGNDIPATLSPEIVTGLLRQRLGFDGIVITDSMSMAAVSGLYGSGEAAVAAVKAGVDMILMPEDPVAAAEGLAAAVRSGEISEQRIDESLRRVLRVKIRAGIIAE